ncbi:MAG: hypothetical protein ACM3L5_00365 [Candidatus Saccharibacteria bacterium]
MDMDEDTEKAVAENIEALAFVDRAIRMDKDKFLDLSRKINDLIEALQKSGANPVTVYYLSRALDQYATDKMSMFGQTVEENRPSGSDLSAESLRKACIQLFAIALEDAAKMSQEDQRRLVDEQKAQEKRGSSRLMGYA